MVHVKLARIGALVVRIVVLAEMAHVRAGIVRIVAPALVIVACAPLCVEMAPVKMGRIRAIVVRIVVPVEMAPARVGMVKIVALVLVIVAHVDPITGAQVETRWLEPHATATRCPIPGHAPLVPRRAPCLRSSMSPCPPSITTMS